MSTKRPSKERIDAIPSVVREEIVTYLEQRKEAEEKVIRDYSFRYTFGGKVEDQSACIAASGQVKAYEDILRLFK